MFFPPNIHMHIHTYMLTKHTHTHTLIHTHHTRTHGNFGSLVS